MIFEFNYCYLNRVIDGDTIDVDIDLGFDIWLKSQRVRLSGIDAPEIRTVDPVEKEFGYLAKGRVTEYLLNSPFKLVCLEYSPHDIYNRIIGDVISGDQDFLTDVLLRENHAVEWSKPDIMKAKHQENQKILLESGNLSSEFVERIRQLQT